MARQGVPGDETAAGVASSPSKTSTIAKSAAPGDSAASCAMCAAASASTTRSRSLQGGQTSDAADSSGRAFGTVALLEMLLHFTQVPLYVMSVELHFQCCDELFCVRHYTFSSCRKDESSDINRARIRSGSGTCLRGTPWHRVPLK